MLIQPRASDTERSSMPATKIRTRARAVTRIVERSEWWSRHHGGQPSLGVRRLAADARLYSELAAVVGDVDLEALAGKVVAR